MKSIKSTIEMLVLIVNAMEAYSAIDSFMKRGKDKNRQRTNNYFQQQRNY